MVALHEKSEAHQSQCGSSWGEHECCVGVNMSSDGFCLSLFHCVFLIFGSGTKLFVTGKKLFYFPSLVPLLKMWWRIWSMFDFSSLGQTSSFRLSEMNKRVTVKCRCTSDTILFFCFRFVQSLKVSNVFWILFSCCRRNLSFLSSPEINSQLHERPWNLQPRALWDDSLHLIWNQKPFHFQK